MIGAITSEAHKEVLMLMFSQIRVSEIPSNIGLSVGSVETIINEHLLFTEVCDQ
jgi:hypothetical protein